MARLIAQADPRRNTDRLFGGPYFAVFELTGDNTMKCVRTGDVFDTRGLHDAWMEGRNVAPIIKGSADA